MERTVHKGGGDSGCCPERSGIFLEFEPKWGKIEYNLSFALQPFDWLIISDMSQSLLFVGNCSENSHFSQLLVLLAEREVVNITDTQTQNAEIRPKLPELLRN